MRRWLVALAVGPLIAGCSVRAGQGSEEARDTAVPTERSTTTKVGSSTGARRCLDGSDEGFIVFSASSEGGEPGTFDLWAVLPDGTSLTQLTDTADADEEYPQVSPDGGRVAYTELRGDASKVRILDCERGSSRSISSDEFDASQGASWSPDGKRLALYGQVGDSVDLFLVTTDDGKATALDLGDAVPYSIPAWSPDGEQVAATIEAGEGVDIVLVPIDGSRPTSLTDDPGAEGEPAWSPDGTRLGYFADADGDNIWTVGADGSDPTTVTADDFMGSYQPSWAPDGKRLVHVRNGPDYSDLVIVPAEGGDEVTLLNDGNINEGPNWWWPPR